MNSLEILASQVDLSVDRLQAAVTVIERVAEALNVSFNTALSHLMASSKKKPVDNRTARWAVRLRIMTAGYDVLADTDPDLAHSEPGETLLNGLPAIVEWAVEIITAFHPELSAPVLLSEMSRRLPSIRVKLSRNRGASTPYTIPYKVGDDNFVARLDIIQHALAVATANRPIRGTLNALDGVNA